jgi:hypothetical protein
MAQTRTITLSETNWQRLDALLAQAPSSDFIRFCLLNEILEEGMKAYIEKYGIEHH